MTGAKGVNADLEFSPLDSGYEEGGAAPEAVMPPSRSQGVDIRTEQLAGRKRRIVATTEIPFDLEQVWQVLTDYDQLADFIPNLTQSQRIEHPAGGIRLVQEGTQCFLKVKFCARVVLDMLETFPRELSFSMVEGDFRQFEGKWLLAPLTTQEVGTQLSYDLIVLPPRAMPAGLIERHIRRDLSQNLKAICDRATFLFGSGQADRVSP